MYRHGRSVSTRFLVLYWFPREEGEEPRLGIAVPKGAGGAVVRSKIKRQLREVWRSRLLAAVGEVAEDIVVFTHFVAINAVVAAAEDRAEVMVFAPANASVTVIDADPDSGALTVVARGSEAAPEVG